MKLFILFVAISLSNAFPAPPQSSVREGRSITDLLRNLKNWNPATVAVRIHVRIRQRYEKLF